MTRLVVVDATPYGSAPSGARRRLEEVLPRLAALRRADVFEVHWALDAGPVPASLVADNLVHATVPVRSGGGALRWRARARGLARRRREAAFTHLLVDHGPVPRLAGVRTVVTVHDLRFLHGYGGLARRLYGRWLYGAALRRAAAVVAVSSAVAAELRAAYAVDAVVARNAVSAPFVAPPDAAARAAGAARLGLPERYVLVVGRDEPRKATGAAVAAWRRALAPRGIGLVLVGARAPDDPSARTLATPSDADLAAAYAGASWTLVPSLCEGYALPIAESLACGTPVVAAAHAAHAEHAALGARGLVLVAPPVRRDGAWSWPDAEVALVAPPPTDVAAPRDDYDATARAVAAALLGDPIPIQSTDPGSELTSFEVPIQDQN